MDLGLGSIDWRAIGHLLLGMFIGVWLGIGTTLWHLARPSGAKARKMLGLEKREEITP